MQAHNNKILREATQKGQEAKPCTCRNPQGCPLSGNCNRKNVIYKATTHEAQPRTYIGVAENFKKRYYSHTASFRHEDKKSATALSEHIWNKSLGPTPNLTWEIVAHAAPYKTGQKNCQLCLSGKLKILENAHKPESLNKRHELAQKCRHKLYHTLCKIGSTGVG